MRTFKIPAAAVTIIVALALGGCESPRDTESPQGFDEPLGGHVTIASASETEIIEESSSKSSSEETAESAAKCPYKIGDLVGPEDLPSRGTAAYMVVKRSVYPKNENLNGSLAELFDEHGNSLYREKNYDEPEICSYEYDDRGNAVREYYDADYYCDNEYDEKGRLISYAAFRDGEPMWSGTSVFDEHGEVSETHSAVYFSNAEPVETVRYYDNVYDDGGRKISSTVYNTDRTVIWEINGYEYDNDILIRRICTETRGDNKTVSEYEYNADGNIVNYRSTIYEPGGAVRNTHREERSYNADGKIEQMLYYNIDGELELIETYEYTY